MARNGSLLLDRLLSVVIRRNITRTCTVVMHHEISTHRRYELACILLMVQTSYKDNFPRQTTFVAHDGFLQVADGRRNDFQHSCCSAVSQESISVSNLRS